jgi:hypothetical protein
MNPWLIDGMAKCRTRDFRHEAAQRRGRSDQPRSRPARPPYRGPSLRTWIGFALVEAGLHLLATTAKPASRG